MQRLRCGDDLQWWSSIVGDLQWVSSAANGGAAMLRSGRESCSSGGVDTCSGVSWRHGLQYRVSRAGNYSWDGFVAAVLVFFVSVMVWFYLLPLESAVDSAAGLETAVMVFREQNCTLLSLGLVPYQLCVLFVFY
ncbi:hypothetical protein LOK49_LG11G02099 [Camellia lanceoleosa]|uniref:Uncharacterized protein n=1 Tax=Camellia lanceoleosa TaxID=1840588 RepID=A0ACC0G7V3_9ERIC|nr:hypothetical protein LOK49_LG11G02099 [Camellia lanceoleosa]